MTQNVKVFLSQTLVMTAKADNGACLNIVVAAAVIIQPVPTSSTVWLQLIISLT